MGYWFPLLTIAGSDSGGAAGLQADLKTWTALGAYGMSVVTVVTAQNSVRVEDARFLPPAFVAAQIDAVLSDYGAAAIKAGFLGRVELVEVVAERLAFWRENGSGGGGSETRPYSQERPFILIDPVLVNHRGESMFPPEVAAAYRSALFPLADLLTPNRAEASLLGLGGGAQENRGVGEPGAQARRVLLKGIRQGESIVDVYWDEEKRIEYPQPLIESANTHGSGDTFSAAICAFVARGLPLPAAIHEAQAYTHAAIARAASWRLGGGHGPLAHFSD